MEVRINISSDSVPPQSMSVKEHSDLSDMQI